MSEVMRDPVLANRPHPRRIENFTNFILFNNSDYLDSLRFVKMFVVGYG